MISKVTLLAFIALLAGAIGCSSQTSSAPKISRAAEEDNIREAMFRHLFTNNGSGIQQDATVYFLALSNNQSPSADFMKRFQTHNPPVKPVSESTIGKISEVLDKTTGKIGLRFRVEEIEWISDKEVHAYGGYYAGNLSASGGSYQLVFENGLWIVKGHIGVHWIS